MSSNVRVRFAPSPTGPLHIGGIRTALYNYLFARQNHGDFILRIEDTDQTRLVQGAETYIKRALDWCGLKVDEGPDSGGTFGPYRQSDRKHIYHSEIQKLIDNRAAYYAFDTVDELDDMRQREMASGNKVPKYDHQTRMKMTNGLTLGLDKAAEKVAAGDPFTVRLFVPSEGTVAFNDQVRGKVEFKCAELDDKVLLKADGLPTYHLANVIDDKMMQISHVIRGEEWLSSTAHHVLLYRAFGWESEMPIFTHLPLILKPSGSGKLSKRDGQKFGFPVFPLAWDGTGDDDAFEGFDSTGFNPAALINFLALLGWNPGTEQEIFSLQGLIEAFRIDQIGKSGARFDYDKAIWFNSQYIAQQSAEQIAAASMPFLVANGYEVTQAYLVKVAHLMRERIRTYAELATEADYFFTVVGIRNQKMLRKKWTNDIRADYQILIDRLSMVEYFSSADLKAEVEAFMEESGRGFGDLLPLLRLAVAGDTKGPDLFAMMEIIGKDSVVTRFNTSVQRFDEALEMRTQSS